MASHCVSVALMVHGMCNSLCCKIVDIQSGCLLEGIFLWITFNELIWTNTVGSEVLRSMLCSLCLCFKVCVCGVIVIWDWGVQEIRYKLNIFHISKAVTSSNKFAVYWRLIFHFARHNQTERSLTLTITLKGLLPPQLGLGLLGTNSRQWIRSRHFRCLFSAHVFKLFSVQTDKRLQGEHRLTNKTALKEK